ncbi:MAG: geranylgeranyl reductase family protein [Pseudomonadota bacterium]
MSETGVDIDVLVVGLGPAGASAAVEAARRGASVLAIDRKQEAGRPVQCAELVPTMIGQEIDGLTRALRQPVRDMTTFVESEPPHTRGQFPGAMIDRASFDADLVRRAEAAGAACAFAVSLRSLDGEGVARLSDGRAFAPRVIVGADGPRSAVGAAVGIVNRELAETRQITVPLLQPFAETDIFLTRRLPGGYAWLFPKREVANLGLGGDGEWRHRFKSLLEDLHRQLIAQGRVGESVLAITGGAIPVGGLLQAATRFGGAAVLLAGDAAGLTNPVTGAGIASAVVSGRLAGEAAAHIAAGDAAAAEDYAEEVHDLFAPSLSRALARRRELMAIYARRAEPTAAELRRCWIAFEEYWAA